MRVTRIYHAGQLDFGQEIELESQAAIHLIRVLRLHENDHFILFNGDGNEYDATITRIHRNKAWARVNQHEAVTRESNLRIILGQGISKGERMDYTIQKAVELGVSQIIPIYTERGISPLNAEREQKRVRHWQGVIASACEQCGRNTIPVIAKPVKLNDWLPTLSNNEALKLTLAPDADNHLKSISETPDNILLLIGSEGGLSENEIEFAREQGFKGIRLGPRVLRTETAALTAISILQNLWGDLS